jgi:hypothetical protein
VPPKKRKKENKFKVIYKKKSCPVGAWVAPLIWFDAMLASSSPPRCCPQTHESFIKSGYEMLKLRTKCWNSVWNVPGSRTFYSYVQEKKGQGKLSLAPNFLLNSVSCPLEAPSFMPPWSPQSTFYIKKVPFFWNLGKLVIK